MKVKIVTCIFSILRSYPEAPFNSRVIAESCELTMDEVQEVLNELVQDGLLIKKEGLSSTFMLSPEGLTEAHSFYQLQERDGQ
jgi:predicted transcriptional regulator